MGSEICGASPELQKSLREYLGVPMTNFGWVKVIDGEHKGKIGFYGTDQNNFDYQKFETCKAGCKMSDHGIELCTDHQRDFDGAERVVVKFGDFKERVELLPSQIEACEPPVNFKRAWEGEAREA